MQMGGHPAQLDDDRGLHCVHALGDTSSELFGRKSDTCLASPQAADAKSRQRAPGQRAECLTAGLQGSYPSTHPLAMQNRPLKHARRVANGVRFVHEVARPSAGAAAPIGRSAASAGPRSRVSSALRQVRFDDGPPRSEPRAPLADVGSSAGGRWAVLSIPSVCPGRHASFNAYGPVDQRIV
jgi:hypothetical protein